MSNLQTEEELNLVLDSNTAESCTAESSTSVAVVAQIGASTGQFQRTAFCSLTSCLLAVFMHLLVVVGHDHL